MMNGRPTISNRKKVQFLVALTILAWATQTLLHQWARGGDIFAPPADAVAADHFIPSAARTTAGATLEVKAEATVHGGEIKLRQICRWANADQQFFAPLADLTIARFQGSAPFQAVSLLEIRMTLRDAGVNLGVIRFAGATTCTVAQSGANFTEPAPLEQWATAREGKVPAAAPLGAGGNAAEARVAAAKAQALDPAARTLREMITADASVRLNLPADQLQMTFNPADEKTLNLAEPQFKFNLQARRVFGLGDVSWEVLIVTDNGNKKVPISAVARAWIRQVEAVRPIAYRQVIQADDLIEKRLLTDHLPDDPLVSLTQCVGQEAGRDVKPGSVLTARMISPVDLVKAGQLVTVVLSSGSVRIKTVALAKEAGTFGQTIKVQNEATQEVYEVILNGPQQATVSTPGGR